MRIALSLLLSLAACAASPTPPVSCSREVAGLAGDVERFEFARVRRPTGEMGTYCAITSRTEAVESSGVADGCRVNWDMDEPTGGAWSFRFEGESATATYEDSHSPLTGWTFSLGCAHVAHGPNFRP